MINKEDTSDLGARSSAFSSRILRLYHSLPKVKQARMIGRELLRSGIWVAAYYQEATRAQSAGEFVSKIECGLQELDGSVYCMKLLAAAEIVPAAKLSEALREAQELTSIFVSCAKAAEKTMKMNDYR
jgi:four helix bundle protein